MFMYVCHDVNVHVGMSWCKCPLVGMSWCKCFFGSMPWCECFFDSMPWCECPFRSMPWCKCFFGSMPWYECPFGSMPWCKCPFIRMQWMLMLAWVCNECKCLIESMSWYGMLWCKHNLFKNSFYFQNEASTTPETKIFSKLDLLHEKSSSFWLKAPKKISDHY